MDKLLIDLNSISKACTEELYSEVKFDDVDILVNENLSDISKFIDILKENKSYDEFKLAGIETLKAILRILYIKQININDFINISLNCEEV